MYQLPEELLIQIFSYHVDPYCLIRDLMVWRQINKNTYSVVESNISMLLKLSVRDPLVLKAPSRKSYDEPGKNISELIDENIGELLGMDDDEDFELTEEDFEAISKQIEDGMDGDEEAEEVENAADGEEESEDDENCDDDDSSEDDEGEQKLFHKSHCFIDRLLHHSLRNQFIGREEFTEKHLQWSYRTESGELIKPCMIFDDGPQFNDKVEEWIEAYSLNKSWLLQLLLEISLGREMIEHLGMRNVGFCIVKYFHKLFEPAIQTVENWKENPKSILEFSDIFNENLYDLLDMAKRKETILKDDMPDFWFEMEPLYNSIPRQVILFIAENFSHINIRLNEGVELTCSVFIFQELSKFGIYVEKLLFMDKRSKTGNYERSPSLNSIIPDVSDAFYLQHFAVWMKNIPLVEWCLDVNSCQTSQTLAECLGRPNNSTFNLNFESYAKTYLLDSTQFSILHYAVSMCNVEMVQLLLEKYFANPLLSTTIYALSPLAIAVRNSKNILKGRRNEEDEIVRLFSRHFRPEIETLKNEKSSIETGPIFETDGTTYEEDNSDLDEEYYSDDIPLYQNVVVEQLFDLTGERTDENPLDTINDCLSDEDYEEGVDFKELGKVFEQLDKEANNSLKRKRFDPLTFDDYSHNFIESRLKDTIAPFESNTWDIHLADFDATSFKTVPTIRILAREGIKKRKLIDTQANDSTSLDEEEVDLISTRQDSCIIPKKRMNRLILSEANNFRYDLVQLPNARMLIQQAAENFSSQLFKLAKSYTQMCLGRCESLQTNDLMAIFNSLSSIKNPSVDFNFSKQFVCILEEHVDPTQLKNNFLDFIMRFEFNEEEDEEFIDNVSSCSSDSMVSNICLVDMNHNDGSFNDILYSSNTPKDYSDMNPALISTNSIHPTIVESHESYDFEIKFAVDREEAIDWNDGIY